MKENKWNLGFILPQKPGIIQKKYSAVAEKGWIMKYISQICIIFGFTMAGEALQRLLPVAIPASVYGLVLLFLALMTGVVKLDQVKEAGDFLRSLLPVLFVGPTVGILEHWDLIRADLFPIILIVVSTTAVTFGISGVVTQRCNEKGGKAE